MNAYRVILGCVVITCYLQQQGWAQTENVQPSIQQTQVDNQLQEEILGDVINQALLDMSKTQSHIQKRQTVSPLERFRQAMRNLFFFHFYCAARTVRRDMRIHYLDVSNTMHKYILVPNLYISDCN